MCQTDVVLVREYYENDLDKDITYKRNKDFHFGYARKGLLNNLKIKISQNRGGLSVLTYFCTCIDCKTKKDVAEVLS